MNSYPKFSICTLCLSKEPNLLHVFDHNETDMKLPTIIRELLQLEVVQGGCIPWKICSNCFMKLKDFQHFKRHATKCKEYLESVLGHFNSPVGLSKSHPTQTDTPILKQVEVFVNIDAAVASDEMTEEERDPLEDVDVKPSGLISALDQGVSREEDSASCPLPTGNADPFGGVKQEIGDDATETSAVIIAEISAKRRSTNMHEKNENEQEILPAEECLSTSVQRSSFEGVQCSGALVSSSELVPLSEEPMDQNDLHLHLSSNSSDQISVVEDCSANITCPETEVMNFNFGDVTRVTVFGGGESVGNREETPEGEKDLKGLKDSERRFSARLRHGAKVPVATRSHLKRRRIRSHCRNKNYGPDEDIELTPQGTGGNELGEENGEHIEREEETRKERKNSNGAFPGNISSGASVGDEKSEGQDYKCDECGKMFGSKDLIEGHFNVPCGSEVIDCSNSNKKYHTRKQYKRHRSLHCVSIVSKRREQRGVAVDVSGESEGKRQIEKRNSLTCHICKKNFSQRGHLNVHIKTVHLKERRFSCEICGKAFGEKGNLQTHMRYHNGVKPYICSHCEKGFTQSGDLRIHIRAVHEMEKPHMCGECGKAFSMKPNLKTHMLVHTGERPHTCDICSKTFSRTHDRERHMLIHTGVNPYTCTLCAKTFRHNHSLKRHMATHARNVPHPCNHCTKTFAFGSELQRHLSEHRGEGND